MDRQWGVRNQHRADALALLQRGQRLTRSEIAESLRLTRATVSDLLGGLLDQGIIPVTEQRSPDGRGRPAEVLDIHPGRFDSWASTSATPPPPYAWRTPPRPHRPRLGTPASRRSAVGRPGAIVTPHNAARSSSNSQPGAPGPKPCPFSRRETAPAHVSDPCHRLALTIRRTARTPGRKDAPRSAVQVMT